jgi:hypothetical protein
MATSHYPQHHGARVTVDRDEEHLRLLGIYHFVVCGINLFALLVLVLLPLMIGPAYYEALRMPIPPTGMVGVQERLVAALLVGGLQTLIYGLNGWSLKNHHNRISCIVMSVIECLSIPLGLLLGISAILVLRRDSVKELFARANAQVSTPQGGPVG